MSEDADSSATDWSAIRLGYPGALANAYLDTACKGIPAPQTVTRVEEHCRRLQICPGASATEETVALMEATTEARRAAAALIGAAEEEIALVESTQHALRIAAEALDLPAGGKVVTSDLEFLAVTVPWLTLRGRSLRLEAVPHRAGRIDSDDLEAAVDRDTRAVAISSVQEVTGERLDLAAIGELCRARGVTLVVDAVQHVGPAPLDVRETPVDVLAVGGHKWMCSPFGTGFLYVRRALLERLAPPVRGYMTFAAPAGGWERYLADPARAPLDHPPFATSARKLELGGTPNWLGAVALASAVGALREISPAAIHARVRHLTELLMAQLEDAGAEIVSPREPERRAGIVVFRTRADPDDEWRTLALARERRVSISLRFAAGVGGLRAAPYFYNDERDVERLVDTVRATVRARAPAAALERRVR